MIFNSLYKISVHLASINVSSYVLNLSLFGTRRVGGLTHQVPIEIGSAQGKALAIRWLLGASRKRPGRNMAFKLSSELVDAAKA